TCALPISRHRSGGHPVLPGRGRAGHRTLAGHADIQRIRVPAVRELLDIVFSGNRAGAGRDRHQSGGRPSARHPESAQRDLGPATMSEYTAFPIHSDAASAVASTGTAGASPGPLLLDVQDLRTWFHTRDGVVKAVNGVSLQLRPGEILGLVGESGSGKSITGFSLMNL